MIYYRYKVLESLEGVNQMKKQFNENSITFNDDIDYISMLTDTSFLESKSFLDSKKCDIDYVSMLIDTSFLDSKEF